MSAVSNDNFQQAEPKIWVSELPPTARQKWSAAALMGLVLVVFGALVPIANRPAAQLNAFFPSLDAIVLITDLITAVLLFTQLSVSRSPSLMALASGYLFTAVIVIPHALTFAGAFSPSGLLGANNQTGSWLFIFWHFGFGASLLAYAILRKSEGRGAKIKGSTAATIGFVVGGIIFLVLGLTWLSTAGSNLLPEIITPQSTLSPTVRYPVWGTIAVTAAALGFLAVHRRSVLDLWLMVVAAVFIMELVFSGLLPSARFSVGFYAGRVLSLITSCIVLILLLEESMRLYAELARSNVMLLLERENRMMNMEAVAASISHELKQPLGSIALDSESAMLLIQRPQPDVQQMTEVLNDIVKATGRANDQLEGIRKLFGRNMQGEDFVDLNDIVVRTVVLFSGEFKSHDIDVRTERSATPPVIYGHRSQLQQVLANLVLNAVEALNKVPHGTRVMMIRTRTDPGVAAIEVEDSGPGIAPAQSGRVFEPFVTSKSQGMGLGLAICRTIVERHGGELTTVSAHPRGTIFRLRLPKATQDAARAAGKLGSDHNPVRPLLHPGCEGHV
jgi:signal transduction histidine kinase